jgi:hypothetical protein
LGTGGFAGRATDDEGLVISAAASKACAAAEVTNATADDLRKSKP